MKISSIIMMFVSVMLAFQVSAENGRKPPELWSSFKDLNKSADACQIQSLYVLDKINLSNLVHNQNGIYGVYESSRVVVKCIPQGEGSKLMVAVAGYDRDSVELLRNLIIREVN